MNDVRVYVGVTMRSADDKGRASPFFSAHLTPASLAQMAKSELKPSKAQFRHFLEPSGMKEDAARLRCDFTNAERKRGGGCIHNVTRQN